MDALTLAALSGTLTSPDIDFNNQQSINVSNSTGAALAGFVVMTDGSAIWALDAAAGADQAEQAPIPNKIYVIWRELYTGAFASVQLIDFDQSLDYSITRVDLCRPGEIGPLPKPNSDIIVPPDSARVLVGTGSLDNALVVRYQYWHSTGDSYSLPPGDQRTCSVTLTTGMQDTSSDQETVASSTNVSASAGWGPISASVSKSLSHSSTTMHSYTVTSQTTRYDTITLVNSSQESIMYIAWQLMDVIDVFAPSTPGVGPAASIVSRRPPLIYDGPYNPAALPAPANQRRGVTDEERRFIRSLATKRRTSPRECAPA